MTNVLYVLPVLAALAVLGTFSSADATPHFTSAEFNTDTRVLTATFSETIDVSETVLDRFRIVNGNQFFDLDGTLDSTADSDTLLFTIEQGQANSIANGRELVVQAGGIQDIHGNQNAYLRVDISLASPDTTPPSFVSATLNTVTKTLTLVFDEIIDVSAIDFTMITIQGVNENNALESINLAYGSNPAVAGSEDSATFVITGVSDHVFTIHDITHVGVNHGVFLDISGNEMPDQDFPLLVVDTADVEARQIGVIVPTTGAIADLGIAINSTIAYAVSEFNEYLADNNRDWRLETQVLDDAIDPNLSLTHVESFNANGIKSFIGPITSASLLNIESYVNENSMLAVSYGSTAPDLAKIDRIFRTITSDAGLGSALADRLVRDEMTYVLPVYRDDVWGRALNAALSSSLSDTDITVLSPISYQPNAPGIAGGVAGQIHASIPRNAEFRTAVVLFTFEEITSFIDTAIVLDPPDARWYGTDTVLGPLLEDEQRSDFLSDAEYTIATLNVEPNRVNRAINAAVPGADVYSYAAYDAVFILGKAIDQVGSQDDAAALAAAIPDIAMRHASAVGDSTLNEFGDLKNGDYVYRTVVDGAFVDLDASGGGSSKDHHKKPTFGMYELTHEQLVSCGYSMDGQCRDVTDYHVDYVRETIQTGTKHDFTLKAYSPVDYLAQFQIAFGVPEVGAPMSEAEATIIVDLARNYTEPSTYQIESVSYVNDNGVIGTDAAVSVDLVDCMPGIAEDCLQLSVSGVLFREQMYHEPFVIYVMDRDRRTATHYMNEGIMIQGESLNPSPQETAGIKKHGNQYAAELIELVRTDKLGDLWQDQWGNDWIRNSHDTWFMVTPESFERHQDGHWNVMTRLHSDFDTLIQSEQNRALLVFDSSAIQSEMESPFAHDMPEGAYDQGARMARLAEAILSEQQIAQETLDRLAPLMARDR